MHLLHDRFVTFPRQQGFCRLMQVGVTAVLLLFSVIQQRDTRAETPPRTPQSPKPPLRAVTGHRSGTDAFPAELGRRWPLVNRQELPTTTAKIKASVCPATATGQRPAGQEAPAGKGLIQAARSPLRRGRRQKDSQPEKHFLWELTEAFPHTFQCSIPFLLYNKHQELLTFSNRAACRVVCHFVLLRLGDKAPASSLI